MSDIALRFSTDILRRLGEELNPSFDQSIVELVKNSYDADSRTCAIKLSNTDRPGGSISVWDDGDGMDSNAIEQGWLILGRSGRSALRTTRLGRTPAGSKGLGRLAALRLGSMAELRSRPRQQPQRQFQLRIDWSLYDQAELVDQVHLEIVETQAPSGADQGTDVTIENLGLGISRTEVKKLARSLILLADPFEDNPVGFKPSLDAPEFSDLENLVRSRYFKDAEFHLSARVDEKGLGRASVTDWKDQTLYVAEHGDLNPAPGSPLYQCPATEFDLWAFLLNNQTFSTRTSTLGEVREWLQHFGGVHLYQNGLRVNPYGNPGNDWLEMNLRRAQTPEERPSTNNSIGRVSTWDTEGVLLQKTDRSGFIETPSFLELKRFATDALEWMARRRLAEALVRRAKERAEAETQSGKGREAVEKVLQALPSAARPAMQAAFQRYDSAKEKEVRGLRSEVQLYRTLSTAGITAATFAHESAGNPIKAIDHAAKTIERRAKRELQERYEATLKEPVTLILNCTGALKVLGNVTLSLLDHEKRRAGRVDVHEVIESVLGMFRPFLADRKVSVVTDFVPAQPYLRGSRAAIECVMTNLFDNSLVWFDKAHGREHEVLVRTALHDRTLTIQFHDNGPGIEGVSTRDVWLPGETTRPNGTGLGLTIVHDAVKDLGGNVEAIAHGELGGASFLLELPVLGS